MVHTLVDLALSMRPQERKATRLPHIPWSSHEKHVLRVLSGCKVENHRLMVLLGRSYRAIESMRARIPQMGKKKRDGRGVCWRVAEVRALRIMDACNTPGHTMAMIFGRSANACMVKLKKLRRSGR